MNKTMKLSIALLAAAVVLGPAAARAGEDRALTPYFNFNLDEGVFVPGNYQDYFSGGNMTGSVGLLARLAQNHSLFGLYNLNYAGSGFAPQDTKEFQSRTLDHNFSFEYRWQFAGPFRVRPGVAFGRGYYRSSANEPWGQGLYDTKTSGGQLAVDYTFSGGALTAQYLVRSVAFPNYTDILREFQNSGTQAQLAGNLEDQTLREWSLSAYWKKLFASIKLGTQDYDNQTVVESNGVYDPNTFQKDKSTTLTAGFEGKLWRFEIAPQASFLHHTSNQNFLNFKFLGDTSPEFMGGAYNYNDWSVLVPFYLNLTQKTALNINFAVIRRNYIDRNPLDGSDLYVRDEVQHNILTTLGIGFRKKVNDVTNMRIVYSIVKATSNNHFETYLPYNYTGQQLTVGFTLAY